MPLYSYKCPSCGTQKDLLQKMGTPAPLCTCENTPAMAKQLTAPGFAIKGEGVYSPGLKPR